VIVTRTLRLKALLDRCIYAGLFLGRLLVDASPLA
jgi:hypothetical protein